MSEESTDSPSGRPGGRPGGRLGERLSDGAVTLRPLGDDHTHLRFHVEHDGAVVGEVSLLLLEDMVGQIAWSTEPAQRRRGMATRAVRLLTRHALEQHGLARVQAYVDPTDTASLRIAGRSGLRREGVLRGLRPHHGGDRTQADRTGGADRGQGDRSDLVVFARLADDPEPYEPEGFRALLNAGLPRKRVISQLAVRDPDNRLLLCQLRYKPDWDLPGGVVEVGESPRMAAAREVREELALSIEAGDLLLVDWLPPWSGWDDACTLVFDGGTHAAEMTRTIVPEPREIVTAQFCGPDQIRELCAPQTARRALAVLQAEPGDARYLESGRGLA
jgi:RimJ/RimL family protein N-acetyltransferase/8-oxo-dGTP pyrophosphatase MutT (NUDIX family)